MPYASSSLHISAWQEGAAVIERTDFNALSLTICIWPTVRSVPSDYLYRNCSGYLCFSAEQARATHDAVQENCFGHLYFAAHMQQPFLPPFQLNCSRHLCFAARFCLSAKSGNKQRKTESANILARNCDLPVFFQILLLFSRVIPIFEPARSGRNRPA